MIAALARPKRDAGRRAEGRMILLGAGTEERRLAARGEMRHLAEILDWNRLTETLRRRRLLATLGPRIVESVGLPTGDRFADAVGQAVEVGRRHAAFLHLVTQRLLAALAEEGIRAAPLKGPQLGEALYGDLGRRQSRDVDLLVAGSRGYGPMARLLLGSVSSRLVATAPCPVLIVPRPGKD